MVPCTNIFTVVHDVKTLTFASHNQLQMYDSSDVVNLLGSSPGTTLHLWC